MPAGIVDPPEGRGWPPDVHHAREALRRLWMALEQVNFEARLAYVLRYIEGLSMLAVAGALNVSLATAKRRIAHAWVRIGRLLRDDPYLSEFLEAPGGSSVPGDGRTFRVSSVRRPRA